MSKNDVRQRKVWIDSDVSWLVGETLVRNLSEEEKRALNFVAEYGEISVSDVQRLTQRSWPSSKSLLLRLKRLGILRHRVRENLDRDPQARFVLDRGDLPQ